jgi:cyclase
MRVSRRQFIQAAGGAVGACAMWPLSGLPDVVNGFHRLRRGTGFFTGRGGTIGWLATPDALVVIDTQFPDTAETFLGGLRRRSDRPIDLLINTHHHGDHVGGNPVLAPLAGRHIAHGNVPELMHRAAADRPDAPEPVVPSETFDTVKIIDLGTERIVLSHPGPAHTGGDAIVHLQEANVVHMGDLVFNRMAPFADLAGGAELRGWIETLESTHEHFDEETLFIFGHAGAGFDVTGTRADLLTARDFLAGALDYARERAADGMPVDQIIDVDALPGFDEYTQNPRLVQTVLMAAIRMLLES